MIKLIAQKLLKRILCFIGYHDLESRKENINLFEGWNGYRGTSRLYCKRCAYISPCVTASFSSSFEVQDDEKAE